MSCGEERYQNAMVSMSVLYWPVIIVALVPLFVGLVAGAIWRGIESGFHVARNVSTR